MLCSPGALQGVETLQWVSLAGREWRTLVLETHEGF